MHGLNAFKRIFFGHLSEMPDIILNHVSRTDLDLFTDIADYRVAGNLLAPKLGRKKNMILIKRT